MINIDSYITTNYHKPSILYYIIFAIAEGTAGENIATGKTVGRGTGEGIAGRAPGVHLKGEAANRLQEHPPDGKGERYCQARGMCLLIYPVKYCRPCCVCI